MCDNSLSFRPFCDIINRIHRTKEHAYELHLGITENGRSQAPDDHCRFFTVRANVHMVYPNTDEVYYTDIVYIVTEFAGELKPDRESVELRWFPVDALPDNIMPTQIDYILQFKAELEKGRME